MPDDANIFGFFAGCRAAAEMLRLCLARSGFFLSGGGLTRPSPFFFWSAGRLVTCFKLNLNSIF
jgi:hypothetical protein